MPKPPMPKNPEPMAPMWVAVLVAIMASIGMVWAGALLVDDLFACLRGWLHLR
jgi:hypothetical protein